MERFITTGKHILFYSKTRQVIVSHYKSYRVDKKEKVGKTSKTSEKSETGETGETSK
jgi:hypothetical protein